MYNNIIYKKKSLSWTDSLIKKMPCVFNNKMSKKSLPWTDVLIKIHKIIIVMNWWINKKMWEV